MHVPLTQRILYTLCPHNIFSKVGTTFSPCIHYIFSNVGLMLSNGCVWPPYYTNKSQNPAQTLSCINFANVTINRWQFKTVTLDPNVDVNDYKPIYIQINNFFLNKINIKILVCQNYRNKKIVKYGQFNQNAQFINRHLR